MILSCERLRVNTANKVENCIFPQMHESQGLPPGSAASTCTVQGGEVQPSPNRQVSQCKQRPTNRFHHQTARCLQYWEGTGAFSSVSPAVSEASLLRKIITDLQRRRRDSSFIQIIAAAESVHEQSAHRCVVNRDHRVSRPDVPRGQSE